MNTSRPTEWRWAIVGVLLTGFTMSLGWRIRGQFGHEIGAAIPGALGAMAVVLLSGREDWWRRIHYFALFGALGWAFGGSMSYMKVVGYTHSSDSATVLYGFAGLYLIGFLWAALGGAGTALAASLDGQRLAALFPALAAVLIAWFLQNPCVDWYRSAGGTLPDLYDSDWLEATVALVAAVALSIVRRRIDLGTSLVLHLAGGWWIAFLLLVYALGFRLNPPRGDNWAGCVGVFAGLMLFCWRHRLPQVAFAALATGTLGASGFCVGQMLKLAGAYSDTFGGMHVVLEWLQGFFHGVALALGMLLLAGREKIHSQLGLRRWTSTAALLFLLAIIPYLNACRIPVRWRRDAAFPEVVSGLYAVGGFIPSHYFVGWIELLFLPLAALLMGFLIRPSDRPLPVLPETALGRGQLLYLAFLCAMTFLSFAIEISGVQPQWFITQWVITLQAVLCTGLILATSTARPRRMPTQAVRVWPLGRIAVAAVLVGVLSAFSGWALKRNLFGDTFAGYFNTDHIRFGSANTNDHD